MAICNICGKEMLKAKGCVGPYVKIDGKKFKRLRFGDPEERNAGWLDMSDENLTCGDCGCHIGGLHHWGCDMETCPKCGEQMISCDCGENEYSLLVTAYNRK